MEKHLLETNEYDGNYVALKSPKESVVVASGRTPAEALENATKSGHLNPTIVYVPAEASVHIY